MTVTQKVKPETLVSVEALIHDLRNARERAVGHELTDEEVDAFTEQTAAIFRAVGELDPEAHAYMAHEVARAEVDNFLAEKVAAGELIELGDGTFKRVSDGTIIR